MKISREHKDRKIITVIDGEHGIVFTRSDAVLTILGNQNSMTIKNFLFVAVHEPNRLLRFILESRKPCPSGQEWMEKIVEITATVL